MKLRSFLLFSGITQLYIFDLVDFFRVYYQFWVEWIKLFSFFKILSRFIVFFQCLISKSSAKICMTVLWLHFYELAIILKSFYILIS